MKLSVIVTLKTEIAVNMSRVVLDLFSQSKINLIIIGIVYDKLPKKWCSFVIYKKIKKAALILDQRCVYVP